MGWRRGQDSNLHGLSPGGFQDRFLTIRIPLRSKSLKSIGYVKISIKTAAPRMLLAEDAGAIQTSAIAN